MALHTFDLTLFQSSFPALAAQNPTQLGNYWTMATAYMNANDGCILSGAQLQLALNLMTAHLTQLSNMLAAGQTTAAPVTGATQGSVTISMQPPPATSGWQFWLATTPYGLQLWALLSQRVAGGLIIGGSLERAAFRKSGGRF
jgi:hypothetical protein